VGQRIPWLCLYLPAKTLGGKFGIPDLHGYHGRQFQQTGIIRLMAQQVLGYCTGCLQVPLLIEPQGLLQLVMQLPTG
jgi:hypothetical protein